MISNENRFKGRGSLKYAFKNSRPYRDDFIVLRKTANKFRQQSRVAIIVSKKTHKSAVARNRVRRRIFEIMRHELKSFGSTYDVIITVTSPELKNSSVPELYGNIKRALTNSGLYKTEATSVKIDPKRRDS